VVEDGSTFQVFLGKILRDLGRDSLLEIAASATIRRFPKRTTMFQEGDPGDALYILVEGTVKVFVTSRQGDEMVLATLGPSDILGEVSLLDRGTRSASAASLEAVTAIALARSTLLQLMHRVPGIGDAVLRSAGDLLRRLTDQAADLVFLDLEGRVAKLLLTMADRRGAGGDGTLGFDLAATQSDLAHMVHGSRQSVNQILHALERRGFLSIQGRRVVIDDRDALRRRAGLD
jgi:CRP/FNR family cyclic AMP-dependent transcriptional regulator